MNNEPVIEQSAPQEGRIVAKAIDFAKVDALRKHMLLSVDSMCVLLGTTRVSYYGWLKGRGIRHNTAKRIREVVRTLVTMVSDNAWPNPAAFVASQSERLIMLQDMLKKLDTEPASQ